MFAGLCCLILDGGLLDAVCFRLICFDCEFVYLLDCLLFCDLLLGGFCYLGLLLLLFVVGWLPVFILGF